MMFGGLVHAAALLAVVQAQAQEGAIRPGARTLTLQGTVLLEGGPPLASAIVYAVDAHSKVLQASGRTDLQGRVSLVIEEGREVLVGVTMRSFEIGRFEVQARDRFRILVRVPPAEYRTGKALASALAVDPTPEILVPPPPSPTMAVPVRVLQGTIRDDVGAVLPGVRVAAFEENGNEPLGTVRTDRDGRFAIVLPPGRYHVVPLAPGLKPERRQVLGERRVQLTMTIDASPETIEIKVGREVIRFRMDDSIWPEYYPPAKVKAWLRFRYCMDVERMINNVTMEPVNVGPAPVPLRYPGDAELFSRQAPVPLSVAVRRLKLEKYWWLKKLYTAPPNPTRCAQW